MQKTIENVKSNIDITRELGKIEGLQLSAREIEELLVDGEDEICIHRYTAVRNETRATIYIYIDRKNKELYVEKFNC